MRIRLVVPLIAALILAGCGSGSPGATSSGKPSATAASGSGPAPGQVDCAALRTAAEQLVGIQLLAQLTTPSTVEAIRSKEFGNLDLDAMLAALSELHALDGVSSALGDPKAAIDVYEKAARAAKALFAMDPVTQAAIDAYNRENVGTIGEFLGRQVAVSGAFGAVGC